jgi:hypothetical protein
MIDVDLLTARLERNPPASTRDIADLVSRSKVSLPPGYIEFMRQSDGAEGPLGRKGRYLVLWPVKSIYGLNKQYHVDEFAPHLLVFGSDGGGEAFAFDHRTEPATIVRAPFIGFDEGVHYGTRFDEFLFRLSEE